jgi:hypothetical protein
MAARPGRTAARSRGDRSGGRLAAQHAAGPQPDAAARSQGRGRPDLRRRPASGGDAGGPGSPRTPPRAGHVLLRRTQGRRPPGAGRGDPPPWPSGGEPYVQPPPRLRVLRSGAHGARDPPRPGRNHRRHRPCPAALPSPGRDPQPLARPRARPNRPPAGVVDAARPRHRRDGRGAHRGAPPPGSRRRRHPPPA